MPGRSASVRRVRVRRLRAHFGRSDERHRFSKAVVRERGGKWRGRVESCLPAFGYGWSGVDICVSSNLPVAVRIPSGELFQTETANAVPRSFHSRFSSRRYKRREEPAPRSRDKNLIDSDLGSLDELLDVVA